MLEVTNFNGGGSGSSRNDTDGSSSGLACSRMATGRFRTDLQPSTARSELLSCSRFDCLVYDCRLPRGFGRGDAAAASAAMRFDPETAAAAGYGDAKR